MSSKKSKGTKRKSDWAPTAKKGAKRARVSTSGAGAAPARTEYKCNEPKCRGCAPLENLDEFKAHLADWHPKLAVYDCGCYGPRDQKCTICAAVPTELEQKLGEAKATQDLLIREGIRMAREKKEAEDRATAAELALKKLQEEPDVSLRSLYTILKKENQELQKQVAARSEAQEFCDLCGDPFKNEGVCVNMITCTRCYDHSWHCDICGTMNPGEATDCQPCINPKCSSASESKGSEGEGDDDAIKECLACDALVAETETFCDDHVYCCWQCDCGVTQTYVDGQCNDCKAVQPKSCAVLHCAFFPAKDAALCRHHEDDYWACKCSKAFSAYDKLTGCFDCGDVGDEDAWRLECKDCEFKGASFQYFDHVNEKHEGKTACSFCGDPSASTVSALKQHLVEEHGFKQCGLCVSCEGQVLDPQNYVGHFEMVPKRVCEYQGCGSRGAPLLFTDSEYQEHLVAKHDQKMCLGCAKTATTTLPPMCPSCLLLKWACPECNTVNTDQQCSKCKKYWRCPVKDCKEVPLGGIKQLAAHAYLWHNWVTCKCGLNVIPAIDSVCGKCNAEPTWACRECKHPNKAEFAECQNFAKCPSHLAAAGHFSREPSWSCDDCKTNHDLRYVCGGTKKAPDNTSQPDGFEFRCADCDFHTNDDDHYKRHKHSLHSAWGMEGAGSQ